MTEITPFLFEDQHMVRSMIKEGEPWFVGKDVCDILEIANSRHALSRLDDDERGSVVISDGTDGNPNFAIINESGLYALTFTSTKPAAKRFKKWVTSEVLPSIRKTGVYSVDQKASTLISKQNQVIKFIDKLKRERNPIARRSLHEMLGQVCRDINIDIPDLDGLGYDRRAPDQITLEFWNRLGQMDEQALEFNHARKDNYIAVNLPELKKLCAENRIKFELTAALRAALGRSEEPRFIGKKVINSGITGKAIRCWVFEQREV